MPRNIAYPLIVGGLFLSITIYAWLTADNLIAFNGKPLGTDFITYWSAASMASDGKAALAYQLDQIFQVQRQVAPVQSVWGWFYPPTFLLWLEPLILNDYLASWLLFSGLGLMVYALATWLVLHDGQWRLAVLLSPVVLINLIHGQNATWTAGLAAIGLSQLASRPVLAGALLGLLSIKPHLCAPIALLLLMHREYRALSALLACSMAMAGIALARYGLDTWLAWMQGMQLARDLNEHGQLPHHHMPTVFATMRAWQVSTQLAYVVHVLVVLTGLALVWRHFRQADSAIRHAAWLTVSLMLSPHLFNYDLTWLMLAMAGVAHHVTALPGNRQRRMRAVLALIWTYPLIGATLHPLMGFSLEWLLPWLMLAALIQLSRRGLQTSTK